jgi:S-adenosylmethionine synthetase
MAFASIRGPGHPDEACDRVARALVDEYVRRDPDSRCDIRVMGGHGTLFISGEVRSQADFDASSVVKAALSEIDPSLVLEPFISIERMEVASPTSADAYSVFGYATDETTDFVPRQVAYVLQISSEIERLRREDPDWYWCGADYDVSVSLEKKKGLAVVRLSHVPSIALDDLRLRTASALSRLMPEFEWKVNPAGIDTRAGLMGRVGSSRLSTPGGDYGSTLPNGANGSGFHPSHPTRRGAELARNAAAELVSSESCCAAWVELIYLPDDDLPSSVRVRTDKGAGFDVRFSPEHFSLKT